MEIEIIKSLQSIDSTFFDVFCKIISYLASYLGFLFVLAIIFFLYKKRFAIYLGVTYLFGVAINYILKIMIDKPRPHEVSSEIINKLEAFGASFPSGHCLSITIMVCFSLFLVYKCFKKKWLKVLITFLLVSMVALTVISRMYLGQHFLSDTIAGVIFGIIYSFFGLLAYTKDTGVRNGNSTNYQ